MPPRRLLRRASTRGHPDLTRRARIARLGLPPRRPHAAACSTQPERQCQHHSRADGTRHRGRLLQHRRRRCGCARWADRGVDHDQRRRHGCECHCGARGDGTLARWRTDRSAVHVQGRQRGPGVELEPCADGHPGDRHHHDRPGRRLRPLDIGRHQARRHVVGREHTAGRVPSRRSTAQGRPGTPARARPVAHTPIASPCTTSITRCNCRRATRPTRCARPSTTRRSPPPK